MTACSLKLTHTHSPKQHAALPPLCLFSAQHGLGMYVTLHWQGGGICWDLLDLQGKLYSAHDTLQMSKRNVFAYFTKTYFASRWYLVAVGVKNSVLKSNLTEKKRTHMTGWNFSNCSTRSWYCLSSVSSSGYTKNMFATRAVAKKYWGQESKAPHFFVCLFFFPLFTN